MGTAAKLHRKAISAHRQYAHFVTVFLTEKSGSTCRNRGLHVHFLGKDFSITAHLVVYDAQPAPTPQWSLPRYARSQNAIYRRLPKSPSVERAPLAPA